MDFKHFIHFLYALHKPLIHFLYALYEVFLGGNSINTCRNTCDRLPIWNHREFKLVYPFNNMLFSKAAFIFLQKSSDLGERRLNVGTTRGEGRQRRCPPSACSFHNENQKKGKRKRNRGGVRGLYLLRRPLPYFLLEEKFFFV